MTAKGFFPLVLPSLLVNDIDAESGVLTDDSTEVDAKQKVCCLVSYLLEN